MSSVVIRRRRKKGKAKPKPYILYRQYTNVGLPLVPGGGKYFSQQITNVLFFNEASASSIIEVTALIAAGTAVTQRCTNIIRLKSFQIRGTAAKASVVSGVNVWWIALYWTPYSRLVNATTAGTICNYGSASTAQQTSQNFRGQCLPLVLWKKPMVAQTDGTRQGDSFWMIDEYYKFDKEVLTQYHPVTTSTHGVLYLIAGSHGANPGSCEVNWRLNFDDEVGQPIDAIDPDYALWL